ncbi:MAG: Ig-like domain-containing protein, partial [Acinetobacter sp.]
QSDLANHAITDDATPTLVGTGLANAVVHISENGTEIGSTTVDTTGNWTFELPTQIDGTHQYTATIINTAGVSGSTQFTLTIDTVAPTTTATLTGITDDSGVVGDYITNDPSLILNGTITGTVEPTDKVQVSVDGGATWQEATIDSATATWTLDHTAQPLTNGQHEVVVRVIDEAGNIGPLSTPQTIIIDTEIPTAQANITGITEDTGVASDFMTADTTLAIHGEITGTLAVDEKVQVRIDSGSWVEATLDRVSNTWTLDNTATPLAEGAHQVETRIIDAAANATTPVAKQIVIDTTASLAIAQISAITTDTGTAGDYITNDNTLLISGRILNTLAANDTVQVSLDNGVTWTNAVVDPVTHTWSLDNTGHPLVDGTYNVQARVIDVVGNVGTVSSKTVVIDTQASSVVSTLTAITEDTGMVGDFSTNDNSLELTGSLSAPLAAGDQVQISLNGGKTWLEATVDPATNTWSYDNTDNPLADGIYKFQTRVIDQAGNVGQVTAQDIVIDTRAPLTSAVFTGITEDTGTTGDYITNDNALVFKGKINGGALAAGDTVQLSLDGGVTWVEATVNPATRTWSYDNTANPLADGTHTLIARVVDKAGNPGFETTQEIQIDTAASTASSSLTSITTDTGVLGDYITSDNSLVFKGKVEGVLAADERVQISLDGGATWLESTLDR